MQKRTNISKFLTFFMSMSRTGEILNKDEAKKELYALLGNNSDHQLIDELLDECRRYEQVIDEYQKVMRKRENKKKPNNASFNDQSYDARSTNNRPQPRRGRGGYNQSQNGQRDQYHQNNQQRGSRNSQYYYTPGQQSPPQLSKNPSSNAQFAKTSSTGNNRTQNRPQNTQNRNVPPPSQQNKPQETNKPQDVNSQQPPQEQNQQLQPQKPAEQQSQLQKPLEQQPQQPKQQQPEKQPEQKQEENVVQPAPPQQQQPTQAPTSNQPPQQQQTIQSPQQPTPQEAPAKKEPQTQPKVTTLYIPSNLAHIKASVNIFGTFAGPLPPAPKNTEPPKAKVQLSDLTLQEQIQLPNQLEIKSFQTVESPHQEEEPAQPTNQAQLQQQTQQQQQQPQQAQQLQQTPLQQQYPQQQMMQPPPFGGVYPPYYIYPGQIIQPIHGQPTTGDANQGIPIPIQPYQQVPTPDGDPNQPPVQPHIPYPVFWHPSVGLYPPNYGVPFSHVVPQQNNINTQNQQQQQP